VISSSFSEPLFTYDAPRENISRTNVTYRRLVTVECRLASPLLAMIRSASPRSVGSLTARINLELKQKRASVSFYQFGFFVSISKTI